LMRVLQFVFLALATMAVPLTCLVLVRVLLKVGRGLDNINRTLEDLRPQANMLLVNLNRLMEEADGELQKVDEMAAEVQAMLRSAEEGMRFLENVMRSPVVRWGGVMAGFMAVSHLFQEAQLRRLKSSLRGSGGKGKRRR